MEKVKRKSWIKDKLREEKEKAVEKRIRERKKWIEDNWWERKGKVRGKNKRETKK